MVLLIAGKGWCAGLLHRRVLSSLRGWGGGTRLREMVPGGGRGQQTGLHPSSPSGGRDQKGRGGVPHLCGLFFFSNTGYLGAGLAAGSTPSLLMLGAPVLKPPSPGFLGAALAGKRVSSFSVQLLPSAGQGL